MSKPIRILHVEDKPFDRSLVRHTLEKVPGDFTLITIPALIGESKMSIGHCDSSSWDQHLHNLRRCIEESKMPVRQTRARFIVSVESRRENTAIRKELLLER